MTAATVYLIAPASLSSWFPHFIEQVPGDRHYFLGEGAEVDFDAVRQLLNADRDTTVVVLSSHDTLLRDRELGERLRVAGYDVLVQSERAAMLGTDKVAMKRFFDQHGFPTARWRYLDEGTLAVSADDVAVVKGRNSTQSIGIRLAKAEVDSPDSFSELYSDGTEYSVVVHRAAGRCVTFPPVWKGPTSPLLIPPWRRLRLCPAPGLQPELEQWLRDTSAAIAEAADVAGHLEVEFLVTPDGSALVLEINPRICGTLRIVAMATGVRVFSLHRPYAAAAVTASSYAAELPYRGASFNAPHERVYATSRLTVAGDTPADVMAALARHRIDVSDLLPDPWTAVSEGSTVPSREESSR